MAKYVLAIERDLEKLAKRSEELPVIGANLQLSMGVASLVKDLRDTLRVNDNLVALAAPQIGRFDRMFAIKFSNGDIRTFINPMITKTEGLHLTREVSPSLPDREFIVPRHDRVIGVYQTPTGKPEENVFEGVVAEVFQHMVQLLDGVLISDIGMEVFEDFDNATEEEQKEVLNAYLDHIKAQSDALNKEIDEDDELRQTRDAIEFVKGLALGEVTLEQQDELVGKDVEEEVEVDTKD